MEIGSKLEEKSWGNWKEIGRLLEEVGLLCSEKMKWLDDFGRMNTKRQTQRMVQVLEIIHSRGVQERKGA